MNHCYRLVFNCSAQVWQAVAETAKSHRKSSKAKALLLATMLVGVNAYADPASNALPTAGQVVSGQSTINQAGNQLNILQGTQKSIINWGSYNIGANATVNYVQPNASAISLNRVTGQDPSLIFGNLNANGQVWLINPNGVLFGQSAQVNVGGLLASTLNITDDDFLNSNYQFTGTTGSIVNMGNIVANNGGYVAMLAPEVRNEGVISALQGTSILAAGDAMTLDFTGNGLINVQVDSANINTLVENKNLIKVGGGQVIMSTKAADGLITSVINNSGRVEADSMVNDGGTVRLTGAKTVINSGEISAKSSAGKGGTVHILGENVGVFDAGSINANGKTRGGTILVGGDYQGKNANIQNAKKTFISQNAKLSADATDAGNGGKVIVWADDTTRYYGDISAKGGAQSGSGGFVEVSGKNYLDFNGSVNTSASHGTAGTLLLDPTNITISTGVNLIESSGATTFQETTPTATSILNTTTLQTALASNNVNVTTASAAASAGTITVANAVTWASGNSLTLTADSTITINAAITTGTAASALILNATGAVTQGAAGVIGGAGGVTKNGAGTFTANRTNTYTGTTTINAGTITMGANNVFADASTILVNGGTLDANTRTDTVAGVRLDSGSITGTTGTLTSTTAYDLRSGTVSKILGGAVGLNKTTAGTVTLGGANTYTGATTITAGTLALNAAGTIAASSGVANAGTLSIAAAKTIDSMTGAGATVLGANTLTIGDASNTSSTYTGIISGTGGITKAGTGTLTLGGVNTYTGATTISAGTLALNATGTIAASSGVANAGTLSIAAAKTIDSMTGAGATTLGANILTIGDASNTSSTYSGVASGTGGITKAGAGTLTLSGANTYTGATNISAGTLVAANSAALGAAAGATTVASGAALSLQGGITIADALTITGTGVTAGGALRNVSGNNTVTGAITLGASGARINSDAGLLTISGAGNITGAQPLTIGGAGNTSISKIIATGAGTLTKDGAGTLTLSGANTYTGLTTVSAGTLTIGANNVFADTSTILVNGGILDANTRIDTVAGIRLDSGSITGTTGALTSTTAYDLRSGTVSKILGGAVGLNKTTASTVTLSGANTYTGATAVNTGTLVVSNANALGAVGGGTTVGSGATLNVNNVTLAESALNINNTGTLTGTAAAVVSGAVTTTGASNIGTTSLASTLTLNGLTTAIAGNLSIVGLGDVTATNAGNNFGTVGITGAKNVSLVDVDNIAFSTSTQTGNLTAKAVGSVIVNGVISADGVTDAITLAGANFINNVGSGALLTTNPGATDRWLVYANSHLGNTFGGLDSTNQAVWNTAYLAPMAATGNRYVFDNSPTVTLTTADQTKTYGQNGATAVANAFTATGFVDAATFGDVFTQDGIANSLTGSATSTGSVTTANVGSYAINLTPVSAATGYTLNKVIDGDLTVNQAALTITANDQTKTYGNAFTFLGTEFTNSALQNGETIGSVTLDSTGKVSNADVGSYGITASAATGGGGFNTANYNISYVPGTMTVNPAIIDLSGTRAYNGTTAFNSADFGTINGVLLQTLNLAGAGSVASANAGAAQTLTLGSLALSDGTGLASNYTLTGGTHMGTINQANLTISTTDVSKTYNGITAAAGTATVMSGMLYNNASNGNALDTISGGTFGYTNANAGIGNKTVTTMGVTVTDGNGGSNYNVTYVDNTTSTINKANLTISTSDVIKTYDGTPTAAGSATVTSGTLYNNGSNGNALDNLSGGSFAFTDKNFGIGNKTVTVTGVTLNDGNSGGNYDVLYANNTTSTINKAALALNAVTDTKTYDGNTNSAGVVGIVGLQIGDNVVATQSFDNKNAGARNLIVDVGYAVNDGNNGDNYTVTTNTAAGTIDPKNLTVTANNRTKTYGQTVNFAGTEFTSAGLIGIETIGSVSLASAGAVNTANVAGSAYAITASNATGGTFDANNYAINYVNGSLTVNRAALTVAANNATKTQGGPNPMFSSTITGFVNGETSAVLIGALNHSTPAVTNSPVGNYAITPFGLAADNYTITFVDGLLTVGRPATISALNGTLTRPEQAIQTCSGSNTNDNVMIGGLDAFGLNDVEYKEYVTQPLVGGVVANALISASCLKL